MHELCLLELAMAPASFTKRMIVDVAIPYLSPNLIIPLVMSITA